MGYWRLIKHYYSKLTSLSRAELIILIQAFFLLPIVRISRRMLFRKLHRASSYTNWHSSEKASSNPNNLEMARRIARMVSIAGAHTLCRSSCLDRSFLLWALLRLRNIDSCLFLGVRRDLENFEAHAWVEINGAVLNDTDDVREKFSPFPAPVTAAGHHFR